MRAKPYVTSNASCGVGTVCQLRGDCYLLPVNGPIEAIVICSPNSSFFSWFFIYSAIRGIHIIPSAPEFSVAVLVLQFPELLIQHSAALSLQVSHKS